MAEPVVQVNNLGKSYWLYPSTFRRIMGSFISPERTGATPLKVLSGLTFDLYPGEAIALIGKNGAGKSTALQILAGIIPPSEGTFHIKGRMSALLELGSGFNPEYTGRENITVAGALAGLSRKEIAASEQEIINFADIGTYIDQPVKFYSSGMFVRLAFSIALINKPDVLLIDEALAVGDVFFQQKCYQHLSKMKKDGLSFILVTHSMNDAQEFCDTAILIEKGSQKLIGKPQKIVQQYFFEYNIKNKNQREKNFDTCDKQINQLRCISSHMYKFTINDQFTSGDSYINGVSITDKNNNPCLAFKSHQVMRIHIQCVILEKLYIPISGFLIYNSRRNLIHGKNRYHYGTHIDIDESNLNSIYTFCHEVKLDIQDGEYTLSVALSNIPISIFQNPKFDFRIDNDKIERISHIENVCSFTVIDSNRSFHGLVDLDGAISISKHKI